MYNVYIGSANNAMLESFRVVASVSNKIITICISIKLSNSM